MIKLLLILLPFHLLASPLSTATSLIKHHESYAQFMYPDSGGYSIGYGTNLTYGISKAEASLLLTHRLSIVEQQLLSHKWYKQLNPVRKAVLLDMAYNLSTPSLLRFKHLIWRLNHHKSWLSISNAMRESLWCSQVKTRCTKLSNIMLKGSL